MTSKDGKNRGDQGIHGQKKIFNIDDLVDGLDIGDTPKFKKNMRTNHQATKAKDQLENLKSIEDFNDKRKELKENPIEKSGTTILQKENNNTIEAKITTIEESTGIERYGIEIYNSIYEMNNKNPNGFITPIGKNTYNIINKQ